MLSILQANNITIINDIKLINFCFYNGFIFELKPNKYCTNYRQNLITCTAAKNLSWMRSYIFFMLKIIKLLTPIKHVIVSIF